MGLRRVPAGGVTIKFTVQVLWMNTVLRTMFPYYNAAVGQQVLEQAVPIINEQLKPVRSPGICYALAAALRRQHTNRQRVRSELGWHCHMHYHAKHRRRDPLQKDPQERHPAHIKEGPASASCNP